MPFEGTQTITFRCRWDLRIRKVYVVYGPYANFEKIVDHMPVYDDSTKDPAVRTTEIIKWEAKSI